MSSFVLSCARFCLGYTRPSKSCLQKGPKPLLNHAFAIRARVRHHFSQVHLRQPTPDAEPRRYDSTDSVDSVDSVDSGQDLTESAGVPTLDIRVHGGVRKQALAQSSARAKSVGMTELA